MLFVTFLQVPLAALLVVNFILAPVIVTQTLVELTASLVYIRLMPRLGAKGDADTAG